MVWVKVWGCAGNIFCCCGMSLLCCVAAGTAVCWLADAASMLLLLADCIFINSANWSLAGTSGALGVWSFLSAVAAPKLLALHWSKTAFAWDADACGCTHKCRIRDAKCFNPS